MAPAYVARRRGVGSIPYNARPDVAATLERYGYLPLRSSSAPAWRGPRRTPGPTHALAQLAQPSVKEEEPPHFAWRAYTLAGTSTTPPWASSTPAIE